MACCIFAAMLITNVLVYWRRLKAFMGYAVSENPGLVTATSAQRAEKNMSLRYRLRRCAVPVLLLMVTVTFGSMHWRHMLNELGAGTPHVVAANAPIEASFFEGAYEFICN
tara:strand:+ start:280 stop:612 length:333 start_codon:yes stop_codon:yes gene_type:complete